ncbi:MAG: 23S rRNA (guanosine(2251)-2'-O)-methyltransferase RlmB [Candidatus Xenobia bacterium]
MESRESNIVYGRHAVLEALASGHSIEQLYVAKDSPVARIVVAKARETGAPYSEAGKAQLDRLAEGRPHQGVVAVLSARDYADVEDVWRRSERQTEDPFLLVIPQIFDPGNLGALIRTAEAAGVHGVVVGKRRSCGLTSTVAKAAAGALERLPVARVSNAGYFVAECKRRNIWVIGADAGTGTEFTRARLDGPAALLLGSEAGLGPGLLNKCDLVVRIPMKGHVESLNVSVAGALLMFEIARQRRERKQS